MPEYDVGICAGKGVPLVVWLLIRGVYAGVFVCVGGPRLGKVPMLRCRRTDCDDT